MAERLTAPEFLSPEQVAALLGASTKSVRRYLTTGLLPFIQPGGKRGRIFIPRDAVAALAGAHLEVSPAPGGAARTGMGVRKPSWQRRTPA
jgi:excisionase family DNA binding protein